MNLWWVGPRNLGSRLANDQPFVADGLRENERFVPLAGKLPLLADASAEISLDRLVHSGDGIERFDAKPAFNRVRWGEFGKLRLDPWEG